MSLFIREGKADDGRGAPQRSISIHDVTSGRRKDHPGEPPIQSSARRSDMKTMKAAAALVISVMALVLLMAGSAQAGPSCHKIDATGIGQDQGGGITTAQISDGGLLQGTTVGAFAVVGFTPPSTVLIGGSVTFTTNRATLEVPGMGTFDVSTGQFTFASAAAPTGTGKLAGATATLVFDGVENLATGSFVETIEGVVCVNLAP
jgi:hypothetical protein